MKTNGHEPLMELVSPSDLDKRYALRNGGSIDVLTKAKIKPAFAQKNGRGTLRLFKRDEALPVIEAYIAARNPVSSPTPAKDQARVEVAMLHEHGEVLGKLVEGNRVVFAVVQSIDASLKKLIEAWGVKP